MGTPISRFIVCGSRTWTNKEAIRDALLLIPIGAVLVHGACPKGADFIADKVWKEMGGKVEAHPADWNTHGTAGGPIRNTKMAKLGADLCLAFRSRGKSNGTDDMIKKARAEGILVKVIEP